MDDRGRWNPERILASPEKKALVDAIEMEMFRKAVAVWKEYFDMAEQRDRTYPHNRTPYGNSVIPMMGRGSTYPGVRDLVDNCNAEMGELLRAGMLDSIAREAKEAASREHDKELKLCRCRECQRRYPD